MEVHIENISKSYGFQKAVDRVSFQVKTGEIVGFLGPNGAGKTTTMRIITCFIPPEEGDVKVGGLSVKTHPEEVKQHIGYLPESNPLYKDMRVLDYLRFVAELNGVPKERIRERIVEIRELIKTIGKEKTVILCSHILAEVEATCDRILIINQGELVADRTAATLRKQAQGKEIVKVTIEEGKRDDISASLKSIESVELVDPLPESAGTFEIQSKAGTSSRKAIFRLCVEKGWALTEMTPVERKLEEVFRDLTISN